MKNKMFLFYVCVVVLMMIFTGSIKANAGENDDSIKVALTTEKTIVNVGDTFDVYVTVDASATSGIDQLITLLGYAEDYFDVMGHRIEVTKGWATHDKEWKEQSEFRDMGGSIYSKIYHDDYHFDGPVFRITLYAKKAANNVTIAIVDTQMFSGNNKISNTVKLGGLNVKILPKGVTSNEISYEVDYINHQLNVTTNNNSQFFLGAEDKKGVVKSYELFEADGTTTKIPLASFSTKKEWKLKLYGNVDNTPTTITLAAGVNKVKAVYTSTETTVDKRIKFTGDGKEVDISKLEYRTAGSQWLNASTLTIKQLDAYSIYGATLIFRIKAVEDKNPYSVEAKMKIAKKANPPKVTIDYSKLTVKITDKMEYRTSHSGTWKTGTKAAVSIKSITNIESNNLYLEVRTAAANGKAASKIAVIMQDAQEAAPAIGTTLRIINNMVAGKTTGVTIKNESTSKVMEYALVDKNTQIASLDLTKQKWKKLEKGSEAALKEKESNGKKIIARYAAITTKGETPKFASKIAIGNEIVWSK